jgi:adenylate cyclase
LVGFASIKQAPVRNFLTEDTACTGSRTASRLFPRVFLTRRNTNFGGLAHLISGNYFAAIDDLTTALRFARSRKTGLENEARILADLANAYLLKGDRANARSFADEAIAVASSRHTRIPACLAHIVRAETVAADSEGQSAEAESDLTRAGELIKETGAAIYQPLLDRVRRGIQSGEPTRSSQAS